MQDYNTREIRATAARLARLADRANQVRRTGTPRIAGDAERMSGETVKAIEQQAESLDVNIRDVSRILSNTSEALYAFAKRLDDADEKAKQMIGSK